MYLAVLAIHNLFRWAVLLLALVVAIRAWSGMIGSKEWGAADDLLARTFAILITLQGVLGLILYLFLSPITRMALTNVGRAMRVSELRYFLVEHAVLMFAALAFAHIGSARARRGPTSERAFRQATIWFTLSLLFILLGIPWQRALLP